MIFTVCVRQYVSKNNSIGNTIKCSLGRTIELLSWFTNLVTSTTVVSTEATKLTGKMRIQSYAVTCTDIGLRDIQLK